MRALQGANVISVEGDVLDETSLRNAFASCDTISFYVDGGMNIVHVKDVVNGILAAIEKERNGERYILAGDNLTHRGNF